MKTKNATLLYLDKNDWIHFRWIALNNKRSASSILGDLVKEYLLLEENKRIVDHIAQIGIGQENNYKDQVVNQNKNS